MIALKKINCISLSLQAWDMAQLLLKNFGGREGRKFDLSSDHCYNSGRLSVAHDEGIYLFFIFLI